MKKTERFVHQQLGDNSAFREMLTHLCEDPTDALSRRVPQRMLDQLEWVLSKLEEGV